jgi:glycosyltransferase involved in cell wall biosynthesis
MAEAVIKLLDDDRLAEGLANNGVKYAQKYDWNKMVKDYVELFHQVYINH